MEIKKVIETLENPISLSMKEAIITAEDLLSDYRQIANMWNVPFELLDTVPPNAVTFN